LVVKTVTFAGSLSKPCSHRVRNKQGCDAIADDQSDQQTHDGELCDSRAQMTGQPEPVKTLRGPSTGDGG
jgi:hypothetical protein